MSRFTTKRRVRHAASDMFDLVADIERYPEFVPLCRSTRVSRRTKAGEGVETLRSEMTVAYKMISETFVTRVTLDKPRLQIHVQYLEGPFRQLENRWTFQPLGEHSCDVEFFISYEFRSRTLGFLMGSMFDTAFRRFAEAFERRADVVFA
jgi:coenzyme Q-binding protein COQ10